VALLVLSVVLHLGPVFYGIELFLLLNYLYRYVPVMIYLAYSRSIKNKLLPLPSGDVANKHFIVLVPAKNEAPALPALLTSARQQDYPRENYRVVVVADNCSDGTAEVARSYGAECIEKNTVDIQPGKGACLAYAAEIFQAQSLPAGTFFVVADADCALDPNYLTEINKALSHPVAPLVLQSYRYVKNHDASLVASFDAASENVRQLVTLGSRDLLGLNAFLHGSGTVFEQSVFFRMSHKGDRSAAEDKEWNAWLLEEGTPIKWCPSAKLSYNVFEKNEEFQKQRVRWVRGQFITARKFAVKAMLQGIVKRNLSQVDYALSLYQVPRSVLIFLTLLCSLASYLYFNSPFIAYAWLTLCAITVPCEMLGLKMDKSEHSFVRLALTGFKMVWGVAQSSLLSSVSLTTNKFWTDKKLMVKTPK
jgi:cellulose synthase/poly-beta-1,6-N-acetylglucosamine synthase-like glycosyltransferase